MNVNDLEEVLKAMVSRLTSWSVPQSEVEEMQAAIRELIGRRVVDLSLNPQVGISVSAGVGGRSHVWIRFNWDGADFDNDEHMTLLAELLRQCEGIVGRRSLKYIAPHPEGAYLVGLEEATLDELLAREAAEEGYEFCGSFSMN